MILEARGIVKAFNKKEILHSINFQVESGKAMGFLGRNGAGKTTTFRCLMNVFNQDSGEFLLDGKPIDLKKHRIGYLPEERGMYGKITVKDQLMYFSMLKGADKKEAEQEALYWISYFNLDEYKNKKLETLSKGNQQKIQIAQAFLNDPDIIILDEPFSGLDPVNAQVFKDTIRSMVDKGKLVIFSSHQMAYVEEMCDQIILINKGEIIVSGDLEAIKKEEGGHKIALETNDDASTESFLKTIDAVYSKRAQRYIIEKHPKYTYQQMMTILVDKLNSIISIGQYRPSLQDIFVSKAGGE